MLSLCKQLCNTLSLGSRRDGSARPREPLVVRDDRETCLLIRQKVGRSKERLFAIIDDRIRRHFPEHPRGITPNDVIQPAAVKRWRLRAAICPVWTKVG